LTITYPDVLYPEFDVQFADPAVTLATQMVAMRDQISGGGPASSADVQKLAAIVAANTLGTIGYAEITADQAAITAVTDIVGLTVTVTVGTGRRIRITAFCGSFTGTVDTDNFSVQIAEGALILSNSTMAVKAAAAGGVARSWHQPTRVLTPTAGSHIYKVQALRNNGTGTGTFTASANQPGYILVEDIGT
jgi:hypothetical protein